MKENNGRAARRQLFQKLAIVLVIFLGFMATVFLIEHAGDNSVRIRHSLRQWQKRNAQELPMGMSSSSRVEMGKEGDAQNILAADLHLINLDIDAKALKRSSPGDYEGVYGIFCQLNFRAHKEDPSSVPMFRDLQAKSPKCDTTRVRVNLKEIARMARNMDEQNHRTPTGEEVPKPLNLTAVAFHESRCGSTLVANTLIGMNPKRHRVYSESPPPITALKVCGEHFESCTLDHAAEVLKDTLYMMSRTNDPNEQRVFFKIQSIGSRHIEVFRHAFPSTPWLYVYRDPVQVMMSHLAHGYRTANCLRQLSHPPKITKEIARREGFKTTGEMSPEMFCAAHLASLTETAVDNLHQSEYGIPVSYEDLPKNLYEHILPQRLGVKTTDKEVERILKVSAQYSKGRGNRKKEWEEDSEQKEKEASEEVRLAAKTFLRESYNTLQGLAQKVL